jgi:hypothetical protein
LRTFACGWSRRLAERRRELENIEYEFKASKYDDPRTIFRDDAIVGLQLTNFLSGTLAASAYWQAFLRGHGWSAGTSEWGGGVGLPRHGRPVDAGETNAADPSFTRQRAGVATDAA